MRLLSNPNPFWLFVVYREKLPSAAVGGCERKIDEVRGSYATAFLDRVKLLPSLGIGVSTEFGALSATEHLDISALRTGYPQFAQFLEVGVETTKGIDRDTVDWVKQPTDDLSLS